MTEEPFQHKSLNSCHTVNTCFVFDCLFCAQCRHLLQTGRVPWCPRPLCQWWSCGKGRRTAAGSTLHVWLAAAAAWDRHLWSSRRKVWGFQNATAARRNSWHPSTRSNQDKLFFTRKNNHTCLSSCSVPTYSGPKSKRSNYSIYMAILHPL